METPTVAGRAVARELPIAPGAHIEVRDAVWRVVQVNQTSSGTAAWHVVGLSEIVRDQEAIFLQEYEPKVTVLDPRETQLVVDTTAGHRSSRLYLEAKLRRVPPTATEPVLGRDAALDVMDYQLHPARLASADAPPHPDRRRGRPRQDARSRHPPLRAHPPRPRRRILVATVKSMLTQFQKELWTRFSIPLVRLDSVGLARIRDQIPTNHNPFHYYDKTIISIDTLKQNNQFRTHVERAEWDVIVIDEAHNVAERGGDRSQRARIAKILSERSDALILLSATPHDGKAESFASLMNMLDPTAISDPKSYGPKEIEGLFVRRFKKDVQSELGKAFPDRVMRQVRATATATEEAGFDALVGLSFSAIDQKRHGSMLFKTTLEKALFSSPAACRQTIAERIKTIAARKDAAGFAEDVERLRALDARIAAIDAASFSKYQRLLQLLRSKKELGWSAKAKDDRLVIFSERIETLRFLRENLISDLELKPEQVELLHGGLSDTEQQDIVERFGKETAKVRILLASDVASEGLNLHFLCHRLVHFDVPWSLMVFAQRNGRIDRYGQEHPPQIVYLLTDSKNERIHGDVRILELLTERDDQAQKNIGDPSALMGQYDEDKEVLLTAQAIEAGESAEAFDARLADDELSPLDLLLRGGPTLDTPPPPVAPKQLSLFESDFAYVREVFDVLHEATGLERTVREADRILEVQLPPDTEEARRQRLPGTDLRRRLRKLPVEVMPADGVLVLTPDRQRIQDEIKLARREESAWPKVSYLWPLHPIVDWCNDKAVAHLGRLEAPVISLLDGLAVNEAVVLVSALLPNRRSQPLFQEWYAVRFVGGVQKDALPFAAWVEQAKVARKALPNRNLPIDLSAYRALIPPAVDLARGTLMAHWATQEASLRDKLNNELRRLQELHDRRFEQLVFAAAARAARGAALGDTEKGEIRARVDKIFDPFKRFVRESMTAGKEPFVEVLAVFRNEGAPSPGGSAS
jgi:superfamily II DNA or RNA helicase